MRKFWSPCTSTLWCYGTITVAFRWAKHFVRITSVESRLWMLFIDGVSNLSKESTSDVSLTWTSFLKHWLNFSHRERRILFGQLLLDHPPLWIILGTDIRRTLGPGSNPPYGHLMENWRKIGEKLADNLRTIGGQLEDNWWTLASFVPTAFTPSSPSHQNSAFHPFQYEHSFKLQIFNEIQKAVIFEVTFAWMKSKKVSNVVWPRWIYFIFEESAQITYKMYEILNSTWRDVSMRYQRR